MTKKAIKTGATLYMPDDVTFVRDFFEQTAERFPSKGLNYIAVDGSETFISYKEQLVLAKKCMAKMHELGVHSGDKVIILIDDSQMFFIAFWMCMLAGFVAIPVAEPTSYEVGSQGMLRFQKIWENHPNDYILIPEEQKSEFKELSQNNLFTQMNVLVFEELLTGQEQVMLPDLNEEDPAFIQYSSGSTGKPKGIVLSNKNIVQSCWATKNAVGLFSDEVVFSWLPHSHNMGIFAPHMVGVISGSNIYTMRPSTFISEPFLFLKKISEHRGNWFVSSNFGFDWLEKNVTDEQVKMLDLSSINKLNNGADPVSTTVIDDFTKKFAPCGYQNQSMRPAYGLSETTLAVTMANYEKLYFRERISREKLVSEQIAVLQEEVKGSLDIVSVGEPLGNVTIRIVDEQQNILNEREVGEVQVAGPLVSSGYFHLNGVKPITNKDGFFPTGDLGYFVGNELILTGRKKDVIIIRGKNYIANDIEKVICDGGVIAQGSVAVTSILTSNQEEQLLIVVQFKDELKKFVFIQEYIKNQVTTELGIQVDYVFPYEVLPRTNTGKIQRYRLKELFEQGMFENVQKELMQLGIAKNQSTNSIKDSVELKIRQIWSEVLGIEEEKINRDATFRSLGGNSVRAYQLLQHFSGITGQEIGPKILLKCNTIADTATYLKENYLEKTRVLESEKTFNKNFSAFETDDIVITGLALRLPDATTSEAFWTNLKNGTNSVKKVSPERKQLVDDFSWDSWMGEITGLNQFDYEFFGITKKEAQCMDPQHRILLELAYQALEETGMVTEELEEQNIATYAAVSSNFFPFLFEHIRKHGSDTLSEKTLVRNLNNVIAAAISHEFNFVGPALAIDTACSSTLVAIHEAVMKLKTKQIDGAVVASSNLILSKNIHDLADKGGILSSDDKSRVFDKNADGSALGEGAIVFYLERKKEAIKNNKFIYGVIKGSAINNDGYSLSIMAPNPKGQYQVLTQAYQEAGISPYDLGMYEAHGTGTEIGDPIEINALSKLFKQYHPKHHKTIGIGSVKTNIGHLLPTAGGASLVKVLLCLLNKKLVPTLNFEELNPKLLLDETPFTIISKVQDWETMNNQRRYAGINSLGLGGTNAHLVVEEWVEDTQEKPNIEEYILTVSAKNKESLQNQKDLLTEFMENNPQMIPDLAYTRNCHRVHYPHRSSMIVKKDGTTIASFKDGSAIKIGESKVAFLWDSIAKHLNIEQLEQLLIVKDSLGDSAEILTTKDSIILKNMNVKKKTSKEINEYKTDILVAYDKVELTHSRKMICLKDKQEKLDYVLRELYLLGVKINWEKIYPANCHKIIQVPHYEFSKKIVWIGQEE